MTQETLIAEAAPATEAAPASTQDGATATAAAADGQTQQAADGAQAGATAAPADASQSAANPKAEPKTDDAKAKPEGAPEKYDFKAPEGLTLSDKVMDNLADVSRELNLSQDAAQKLVDKMAPAMASQQQEALDGIKADWRQQSEGDKEFGGDKLQESMGHAKKALDAYGTPEFKQLLETTGLGNHPEVIRVLTRAGKAIGDDKLVTGDDSKSAAQGDVRRIYRNTQMNP